MPKLRLFFAFALLLAVVVAQSKMNENGLFSRSGNATVEDEDDANDDEVPEKTDDVKDNKESERVKKDREMREKINRAFNVSETESKPRNKTESQRSKFNAWKVRRMQN